MGGYMQQLLNKIRFHLEDRNLIEVSKRSGVGYSALRKIMKGETNISLRTILRLSDYLGVNHEA
jgi:transcriptional regulator with XRE-family HTH domain